jgi:alkylation response protein AidB-like acyl-CoA dehydrogenase
MILGLVMLELLRTGERATLQQANGRINGAKDFISHARVASVVCILLLKRKLGSMAAQDGPSVLQGV